MTFREFTGKNVEEAIRTAMAEFSSDLSELDIEILAQGSRGVLGVGAEEARILAAPKSAVAAAESVRVESPSAAAEAPHAPRQEAPRSPEREPEPAPQFQAATEDSAPVDLEAAAADADEQVAELERADAARRTRGSRGRGGGRNGRERDREHAVREPRPDRPPREPRSDRPGREPAPFVSGKPVEELTEAERSTLETAKTVLTEMLGLMELSGTVEIASGGDTSRLNVRGDDLGALIGRRGEKLASLQHIVNLIVGRREGQHHRIAIDVENYRGRREQQLRDVADRAAKRVVQTGKIIQLEAMPAIERRVVHMALLENPRIRTQSVGVEPNRRIVVLPASQVKE
ncbi:MAG TPA: RNA-binding cell elongation regulator Jag/EloR [Candidatus Limnocylindrales bacterium]|nr:RNA-binding cell elongation regulator Jag/EloR [Candidatus Limnocylindrales bacterium]